MLRSADLVGDDREIDDLLSAPDDGRADVVPSLPENPRLGPATSGVPGKHRLICGDCTDAGVVAQLLGTPKPQLMVPDPPYGIELDTKWRDRPGGTISGYGNDSPENGPDRVSLVKPATQLAGRAT